MKSQNDQYLEEQDIVLTIIKYFFYGLVIGAVITLVMIL